MVMAPRNSAPLKRVFLGLLVVASVAFAITTAAPNHAGNQTVTEKSLLAGSDVPTPVREILQRACRDCHSENTVWPWYAQLPVISSQIHNDVKEGRSFMNLSKWNDYTEGQRRGFRTAMGAVVQSGLMPPPKYLWLHRDTRLSDEDRKVIRAWALARPVARSHQ